MQQLIGKADQAAQTLNKSKLDKYERIVEIGRVTLGKVQGYEYQGVILPIIVMNRPPSLDHSELEFPASFRQGGPCAADGPMSVIGGLLPIAL